MIGVHLKRGAEVQPWEGRNSPHQSTGETLCQLTGWLMIDPWASKHSKQRKTNDSHGNIHGEASISRGEHPWSLERGETLRQSIDCSLSIDWSFSLDLLINNTPLPSTDQANIASLNKMDVFHTKAHDDLRPSWEGEQRCSLAALRGAKVHVGICWRTLWLINQSINRSSSFFPS